MDLEYEEIGKRGEKGGQPGEEGQKVRAGWGQWSHHCLVPATFINFEEKNILFIFLTETNLKRDGETVLMLFATHLIFILNRFAFLSPGI